MTAFLFTPFLVHFMSKMIRPLVALITLVFLFFQSSAFAVYPPPASGRDGMVVSAHHLATQVGVDILKQGGNAVDAAVAMGYALAVVYPGAGNLGGGGFMTLHLADGRNVFLNFREKAPLAATANMYLDAKGNVISGASIKGYLAVGVPGTVLGLDTALKKYGTMPLAKVMAPAIQLAEQGFVLSAEDAKIFAAAAKDFSEQPNVAAIFLKNGQPYVAGDRLKQLALAKTLKTLAAAGSDPFYKGPIAEAIAKASKENGGILTKEDFSNYQVQELTPLQCQYKNYTIISAPPPSSGGVTLCEILNIVEPYPLGFLGFHSAQATHYLVEAMRYAYYDRNNSLGDPDFVKNPVDQLISKDYAATIRDKIPEFQATPSSELTGPANPEGKNTTHFSIVDKKGNAVSVTYTLNNRFGARVIAGDTGFFLNDEMDDFTTKLGAANLFGLVQGEKNAIQAGKRPLSSMAPTIVMKDGKLFMVIGSPGGSAIPTAILETFLNAVEYGMDIKSAVDSPRFHFQWLPDSIQIENLTFSRDTQEKLAGMGYRFNKPSWPLGIVEAILIDPEQKILYGANDDRIPLGAAMGY